MIIVDREKLQAVSSEQDPKGQFNKVGDMYAGTYYGDPIYANTSIHWGGRSWSMVLWPLPEDKILREQLMFHEAFHSVQAEIGFPMDGAFNDHLDQEQARVLIRLEWNALLKALTDESRRKEHLQVALHLRNKRFSLFPDAKKNEEALEINEGLAEYTGTKLRGSSSLETIDYLQKRLEAIPEVFSLARSSAYYSGPLYGLLFDAEDINWKSQFSKNRSFAKTSEELFKITMPQDGKSLSASILQQYENSNIIQFEHQRAVETKEKISKYLKKINKNSKLRIRLQKPMGMFNPYGILSVSKSEIIYVTYDLRDVWGTLVVTDGAYLKKNNRIVSVTVSPPTEFTETTARGTEWELKLNPGWKLIKKKNHFTVQKI
ncbi:MAG: hypothetical protein K2Q26_04640 [Bdellovibrionales bacterium]|nr:hypothetical protein [Bdellovibrionales bacterium]